MNVELLTARFAGPDDYSVSYGGYLGVHPTALRARLDAAIGPGKWGLRPAGPFQIIDGEVIQHYTLVIEGVDVTTAPGGAPYDKEKNKKKTLGYALEHARTNALQRACKDLGVAPELGDQEWADAFRDAHFEKGQFGWKRKTKGNGHAQVQRQPAQGFTKPAATAKPLPALASPWGPLTDPPPSPEPPPTVVAQDPTRPELKLPEDRRKAIILMADVISEAKGTSPEAVIFDHSKFTGGDGKEVGLRMSGEGKMSVSGASEKWINALYGKMKKTLQDVGFSVAAGEVTF